MVFNTFPFCPIRYIGWTIFSTNINYTTKLLKCQPQFPVAPLTEKKHNNSGRGIRRRLSCDWKEWSRPGSKGVTDSPMDQWLAQTWVKWQWRQTEVRELNFCNSSKALGQTKREHDGIYGPVCMSVASGMQTCIPTPSYPRSRSPCTAAATRAAPSASY